MACKYRHIPTAVSAERAGCASRRSVLLWVCVCNYMEVCMSHEDEIIQQETDDEAYDKWLKGTPEYWAELTNHLKAVIGLQGIRPRAIEVYILG